MNVIFYVFLCVWNEKSELSDKKSRNISRALFKHIVNKIDSFLNTANHIRIEVLENKND